MISRGLLSFIMVIFLMLSDVLVGCSTGSPEKQARSDLLKWFETRWPGTVSMLEFKMTKEDLAENTSTLSYRAKLQFVRDTQGCVPTCCGDVCFEKMVGEDFRWVVKTSSDPNIIRRGDTFEIRGNNTYKKAGNEWIRENAR